MEKEVKGLSLPKLEQTSEPVYMLEDKDGWLVRVPHSKVAAWKKAQKQGDGLNKADLQSGARAASMLYKRHP